MHKYNKKWAINNLTYLARNSKLMIAHDLLSYSLIFSYSLLHEPVLKLYFYRNSVRQKNYGFCNCEYYCCQLVVLMFPLENVQTIHFQFFVQMYNSCQHMQYSNIFSPHFAIYNSTKVYFQHLNNTDFSKLSLPKLAYCHKYIELR